MTLPRRRERPRRKTHPVQPEWATPEPVLSDMTGELGRSDPAYRAAVDQRREYARGLCEARIDGQCLGHGTDPHHLWPVSEGGPVVVPTAWLLWVCRPCHGWIHSANHRDEAAAAGLITPTRKKVSTP